MRGPRSYPKHLPKSSLPNTITWTLEFQHMSLGEGHQWLTITQISDEELASKIHKDYLQLNSKTTNENKQRKKPYNLIFKKDYLRT